MAFGSPAPAGSPNQRGVTPLRAAKSKWYEPARRINPLLTLTTFLRFELP